jgi:hypothetical protein
MMPFRHAVVGLAARTGWTNGGTLLARALVSRGYPAAYGRQVDGPSARDLAFALLSDALPRRWRHVQAVAARAASLAWTLPDEDRAAVVDAAWLHDVGYAPELVDTGFHALDGARWLRHREIELRVVALVAYHSCAVYEAQQRGLADQLRDEFEAEQSPTADLLWYADMTTGPEGVTVAVEQRLAEVRHRYGPDDVVTRFWRRAEPILMEAVCRVERRLNVAQPSADAGPSRSPNP